MYEILDWAKLRHFSHIIWDIDGTITERDKLSGEATIKIINLALQGVYHSFITGRDGQWIVDNVIRPMAEFFHFGLVQDKLTFFAEVGCVSVRSGNGEPNMPLNSAVENHPLCTNRDQIRNKLRELAYDPETLTKPKKGQRVPSNRDVVYDANGVAYLIDRSKGSPKCHPYIWSPYKKAFATLEKIRDEEGKVKTFDQQPFDEILMTEIRKAGLEDLIRTEIVSTAINIVPVINHISLGKSWAAGIAIENIVDKLHGSFGLEDVLKRTVAIGDGLADLDFTHPTFTLKSVKESSKHNVPMIFVGQQSDLPQKGQHREDLVGNIIIKATGLGELQFKYAHDIIQLTPATGPRVASAILDFLKNWDYFGGFK